MEHSQRHNSIAAVALTSQSSWPDFAPIATTFATFRVSWQRVAKWAKFPHAAKAAKVRTFRQLPQFLRLTKRPVTEAAITLTTALTNTPPGRV